MWQSVPYKKEIRLTLAMRKHRLSRAMRHRPGQFKSKNSLGRLNPLLQAIAAKVMKPNEGIGYYLYTVKKVARPRLPMYSG